MLMVLVPGNTCCSTQVLGVNSAGHAMQIRKPETVINNITGAGTE